MNNNKKIKNEYERLKKLFASVDPTKTELVDNLLNEAAFMKVQLSNLQEQIKKYGAIQISSKGNIVVGKELFTVIQSLINDMDNPRYIFDEKPGNIRIEFIETFCKHTKSPFNGQPFLLELWEKAVLQAAYGFKMADTNLRRFNEVLLRSEERRV